MRALIVLALLLAAVPAQADFLSTFGIAPFWDMERTKERFLQAGIDEYREDGSKNSGAIRSLSLQQATLWADTVTKEIDPRPHPANDCLYYRNGIEPRDDIFAIAVCFLDKKYQHLTLAFFRRGKVDGQTLRQSLTEKYGEPTGEAEIWTEHPAIYGKLLATKYVYMVDLAETQAKDSPELGISVMLTYVNRPQLAEYVNSAQEAIKQAAEKAKKERHKGL